MFQSFVPNLYVPSIYAIDLESLQQKGIRSVIVDLDNTLVASDCAEATPKLIGWLDQLRQMGFQVIIVSNNSKARVSAFSTPLQIPFIYTAKKPLSKAFHQAIDRLGTQASETVVIGDQLLTDVLGGNRMGLYTILVVPVSDVEGRITRMNRRFERVLFRWMKKKGLVQWEKQL